MKAQWVILLEVSVGHVDGGQKWISMSVIARQFRFEDVKINKTFLVPAISWLLLQMVLIYWFLTFQFWQSSESFSQFCRWIFYTLQPYSTNVGSISLLYRYLHGICSDQLYSVAPQVQPFAARTNHVPSRESNHPRFPSVPNVGRKSCSTFYQELSLSGTDAIVNTSLKTTPSTEV